MSTSSTPPLESVEIVEDTETPVHDNEVGEVIPQASPAEDNVVIGAENEQREVIPGSREITPGTEEAEEITQTRNSAEGENENDVENEEGEEYIYGSNKENQQQALPHDLDKDIDAVLENNVKNGQVGLSGLAYTKTVDSAESYDEDEESGEDKKSPKLSKSQSEFIEGDVGKNPLEVCSERSFTPDTDSSALAESVVKTVLEKAVDIVRSEENLETFVEKQNLETEGRKPELPMGDIKVGLFQYQGFDDEEDETENLEKSDEDQDKQPVEGKHDAMVGLFQYTNADETDRVKSPEVSEIDDVIDDQDESMNEEEKSNILKLYGLEGVEPISPKSASPSESGTSSLEDKLHEKVLDVQREVYEPSTRHFSITRDTSSNESTPRIDENGVKFDNMTNGKVVGNSDSEHSEKVSEEENSQIVTKSMTAESDKETEEKQLGIENSVNETEARQTTSISPPLVQYEPVKENGKFRIIKTTKEGGGTSYSAIRVGDMVSPKESPRSVESQKESLRETLANSFPRETVDVSKKTRSEADKEVTEESEKGIENVDNVLVIKGDPLMKFGMSASAKKHIDSAKEYVDFDRDRIRKLLEEENAPLKLSLSKDTSVSRDSGVPRSKFSVSSEDQQQHLSMSQLGAPHAHQFQENDSSRNSEGSRIRYTTRDIAGREVKRVGPKPNAVKEKADILASDSRYLQVHDGERLPHERDRYV